MKKKIQYNQTHEFERDLKRLLKKYSTLGEDLETVKRNAIELFHVQGIDNHSVQRVSGYCYETIEICKIKKFACKSLKGKGNRSGIRVIYAFYPKEMKVKFLEIYYKKKDNTDMNYNRAKEYLKGDLPF